MLELEEARQRILAVIPALAAESIPVDAAVGRIIAESIHAPIDLPGFDNSAMDGYAVRADDLKGASAEAPVTLQLCGEIPAGAVLAASVERGTCARIYTGSAMPPGADAVVMQEDTRPALGRPTEIAFLDKIRPWENVRLRGEDVKRDARLFSSGEVVRTGGAGLMAALGLKTIRVNRQPVIGLLSTGSELLEAGQSLAPGKIYESNRVTLAALLVQAGAVPKVFPLVPDTLGETQAALEDALNQCDAVITTGGVSVGEHDHVKKAFEQIGGVMEFWKVAVKPGKPFVFGRRQEKFLFGLPGNPVSALVTFLLLVRPALRRWQGAADVDLPVTPGRLAEPLVNRAERRHFVRVKLDAAGEVHSTGLQASHILSSLAQANGLVDVPPQTSLASGATVRVLRWE